MWELLVQHQETSTHGSQVQGKNEKRKSKILKWPHTDFSNLLLASSELDSSDLIKQQEWKYAENKFQFFSDVLVFLVTILFNIFFGFTNYS